MQREYRVRWEIDILAHNKFEAAKEAQRIQRDPESTATFFTVRTGIEKDDMQNWTQYELRPTLKRTSAKRAVGPGKSIVSN